MTMKDAYSIGIEEEYFLVDASTKLVTREMPKTFLAIAKEATNGQAMGEFLQSQCEVATLPHHDIRTAHAELRHLRQTVAKIAADHGLAIVAAVPLIDAEVDAKARTAVLALGGAPLRARLGQKHGAELRFDAEIDVGPADALKVD